ncbi:hypothetical protein ACJX0J_008204, partial [Zea mays]
YRYMHRSCISAIDIILMTDIYLLVGFLIFNIDNDIRLYNGQYIHGRVGDRGLHRVKHFFDGDDWEYALFHLEMFLWQLYNRKIQSAQLKNDLPGSGGGVITEE